MVMERHRADPLETRKENAISSRQPTEPRGSHDGVAHPAANRFPGQWLWNRGQGEAIHGIGPIGDECRIKSTDRSDAGVMAIQLIGSLYISSVSFQNKTVDPNDTLKISERWSDQLMPREG